MHILVTGGTGYIGSHTVVELVQEGHSVVVVDNLVNSSEEALRRVAQIVGQSIPFVNVNLCDPEQVEAFFASQTKPFDCCMHFAGLKAVGESVAQPLRYYRNNLDSTMVLAEAMGRHGCKNIIFSSSATVYGTPEVSPITEEMPKGVIANPYGRTKSMIEDILTDVHTADPAWNVVLLRYFNPIGAHPSGLIGEDPTGIPNNLMPYITQVAVGKLKELGVFGNDYNTPDGTGVRDYIHVVDLAKGHVKALQALDRHCGVDIYNLGTGHGYSVLDVVNAFQKATGIPIPYSIKPRRPGDIDIYYSDPTKAKRELGWEAKLSLEDMCADAWRWQKNNPKGYRE